MTRTNRARGGTVQGTSTGGRRVVFGGSLAATLVALAACVVLSGTPGYLFAGSSTPGRPAGDLTHYVAWTRLVTLGGLERAYSGTYPETLAVYGPVVLASYRLAGGAYRAAVDPSFDPPRARESLWLRRALKLVALAWHLAAGVALIVLVGRTAGRAWAAGAGALYLANPAAVVDVGHWGQPDGAHALFAVLATGLAAGGLAGPAGAALALAALSKPQAWALVPVVGFGIWQMGGRRGLAAAAAGGAAAAALALLPFIAHGRVHDLLALPHAVADAMPVVSANAHNAWWLVAAVQGHGPLAVPDSTPLAGPVSYRAVAAGLLAGFLGLVAWLVRSRRVSLAEGAALWTVGWFVLATQVHENHAFVAIPLLVLALPRRPALLGAFALLTATSLLNLLLQDPLTLAALGLAAQTAGARQTLADLRTLNAVATVALLLVWSVGAARRRASTGAPRLSVAEAPGVAWQTLLQDQPVRVVTPAVGRARGRPPRA
jgi:hypothetical protein